MTLYQAQPVREIELIHDVKCYSRIASVFEDGINGLFSGKFNFSVEKLNFFIKFNFSKIHDR